MLSILRSLRTNIIHLDISVHHFKEYCLPSVQSYFRCIDMQARPALLDSRILERQTNGFDLSGDGITFRYPKRETIPLAIPVDMSEDPQKPALDNLTFHFDAGKIHAIVGDNGSGKSTLVYLLSQLYKDYTGIIKLNGHDIKEFNPDEIRSHVSIMFQEVAKLVNFSVRENIGIGEISILEENSKIIDAIAAEFKVTDFINLDVVIGNLEKKNKDPDEKWQNELSGGQWQKIALARAFMRAKTADLLIFDEPTSSLDIPSEMLFFQHLRESRKNKTTIFITHKYVTTPTADVIHFIQDGRIVERGSHSELMASQGEYARRYLAQTQGYLESKEGGGQTE